MQGDHVEIARLDAAQQVEVTRAIRSVANERAVRSEFGPAEHGVRWSDMDLAVYYATAELEMAIVRVDRTPEALAYLIETIDEKPATLIVRRRPAPEMYEAEATVGRFGNEIERAQRLVKALDQHLRSLGSKRSVQQE